MCGTTTTNGTVKKGTSSLVKPKFGPGMLLQHEDLDALHTYTRDLNRLLFSSLFGCGVICGLEVEAGEDCGKATLTVKAGVALNCTGDPLHVPKAETLTVDEDCDVEPGSEFWVLLCPAMKCCGPRQSMCACDDEEPSTACTRERYGYEIRVVEEEPGCACRCKRPTEGATTGDTTGSNLLTGCVDCGDCHKDHYDAKCKCACDSCEGGGCDCVVLALVGYDGTAWDVDYRVRRLIRPALIKDRLAVAPKALENEELEANAQGLSIGNTRLGQRKAASTSAPVKPAVKAVKSLKKSTV